MITSNEIAKSYIVFLHDSPCHDTRFVMTAQGCTIYQPIDDEEESKYVVVMDHCDLGVWNQFYSLVLTHKNVKFS